MELIAYLEQSAADLTERVLAEQYRDPFWYARYGERADRHGKEDGGFHIKYLVTALGGNDPGVMTNYARWLQTLLTSHGMCTLHIDDNFRLLAEVIEGDGHADRAAAIAMLDAARAGLVYVDGPARAVQQQAAGIAQKLASSEYLVSYVADAIALGDPSKFRAHVTWTGEFLDARGLSREALTSTLRGLHAELADCAPAALLSQLFDE